MPTVLNASGNAAAGLRAQAAAFREFQLRKPPTEQRELELWLQHAAGFILFEKVRGAGLATLEPDATDDVRLGVELAIDATVYALMMQIDGVAGGIGGADLRVDLTFGVELTTDGSVLTKLDLRDGDGMCMGFHSWVDGEFGEHSILAE